LALTRLSITEEEAQQVRELLGKGLSTYKIANITGINQPKIWRNIQIMGLTTNKKEKPISKSKCFNWKDYNNCVI